MLKRAGSSSFTLRSGGGRSSSSSTLGGCEPATRPTSRGRFELKHQLSWNSLSSSSSTRGSSGATISPQTVIVLEGDAETPVIGSIECVRTDKDDILLNASSSSSESKDGTSASSLQLIELAASPLCRDVVRIICRPPPSSEQDDSKEDSSHNNSNQDLVQFLVDSISELVDQQQPTDHPKGKSSNAGSSSEENDPEASAVGGVIEALSFACMNPCVGGSSNKNGRVSFSVDDGDDDDNSNNSLGIPYRRTKSILRTRGTDNGRSPVEAGILSDRTVSFSRLEIHEFGMTLGDHPSAVSGPPVALDYDGEVVSSSSSLSPDGTSSSSSGRVVSVEEYERVRTPRRHRKQLKLSYHDKCATLRDKGFSLQELHDAWAEAILIRKQRQETLKQTYTSMVMDDFWESAGRKYHRILETLALA